MCLNAATLDHSLFSPRFPDDVASLVIQYLSLIENARLNVVSRSFRRWTSLTITRLSSFDSFVTPAMFGRSTRDLLRQGTLESIMDILPRISRLHNAKISSPRFTPKLLDHPNIDSITHVSLAVYARDLEPISKALPRLTHVRLAIHYESTASFRHQHSVVIGTSGSLAPTTSANTRNLKPLSEMVLDFRWKNLKLLQIESRYFKEDHPMNHKHASFRSVLTLFDFSRMTQLQTLVLHTKCVWFPQDATFPSLTSLCCRSFIRFVSNAFPNLPQLTHLCCQLVDVSPKLCRALPSLQSIVLGDKPPSFVGIQTRHIFESEVERLKRIFQHSDVKVLRRPLPCECRFSFPDYY